MAKKRRNREKENHRPKKQRFTLQANRFYKEQIAPCAKTYRKAMKAKQYQEAADSFSKLQALRQEHRLLLARKQKIRIR